MAKKAKGSKKSKQVAANSKADSVISLKAGVTPEGRRGLMGKMVEHVAKSKKVTRGALVAKFGGKEPVKVSKNIQWGIRHDVFKEARA